MSKQDVIKQERIFYEKRQQALRKVVVCPTADNNISYFMAVKNHLTWVKLLEES